MDERSAELRGNEDLDGVVATLLDRAISGSGAERGNVQLFHPRVGGLTIAGHRGFDSTFLGHFALVADDGSACGRAAGTLGQVVIEDVESDADFAPHIEVARASGFRAVQSTPVLSAGGSLVGMVSTHYAEPHRPSSEQLELLESYGRSYGGRLAELVARPGPDIDVLVVDDHEAVRTSLATILENAGYRVDEAGDGVAALGHLATTDIGLMLLDVTMPVLDGLSLLNLLDSPPPTIVLSANSHASAVRGLGSKVTACFVKPAAPDELLSLVADTLGR